MKKYTYEKSRRRFLLDAALGGVALGLRGLTPEALKAQAPPATKVTPLSSGTEEVQLSWLGGAPPVAPIGVSWGVPWPRGRMPQGRHVALRTRDGHTRSHPELGSCLLA